MAIKKIYVTRAMFLGQRRISCSKLNPFASKVFLESIGCWRVTEHHRIRDGALVPSN